MINNQIKDRILRLLNEENLSSSKFADILNVQRSSISHIISGRNKPSLDFIQKVLRNFSQINPDWLILGKGEMYIQEQQKEFSFDSPLDRKTEKIEEESTPIIKNEPILPNSTEIVNNIIPKVKSIEKIVVFFDDGTFEELNPKKSSKK